MAVIAIDIGEANPLASVVLRDDKIEKPEFLGKEVRDKNIVYEDKENNREEEGKAQFESD